MVHPNSPNLSQNTWLKWIWELYQLPPSAIYKHAGIDALVYHLFHKTVLKICVSFAPLYFFIHIPVYATAERELEDGLSRVGNKNTEKNNSPA